MNKRCLIVGLIILTAFVFRFHHIQSLPPGLYPDEAMNGNNALEAIGTNSFPSDYKIFYPENNGREGLFINLQAQSIKLFGNHPWALRLVSGLFGVLTVLGVYFLAQQLFNWQIGALSSFLLAISFWHTLFSRIGFRAIMAPFAAVWGFYFLWRGLARGQLWAFACSGIFLGLGFHSYIAFRIMPLVVILALLAHWQAVRKDFSHEKYIRTRTQIIQGLALLLVTFILVVMPIAYYFYTHPQNFFGRLDQVSVFSDLNPVKTLATNVAKTLGMFNFSGDYNWRHNFAGEPLLFLPIGLAFVAGLFRSVIKLTKHFRRHGHFSSAQTLLLSWFLAGLAPTFISNEGLPHALRAIIVAPVVFIFAGEGLWWVYERVNQWYQQRDVHELNIHKKRLAEGSLVASLVIIIVLVTATVAEYDKYFFRWRSDPNISPAFSENYVQLGNQLNQLPLTTKKYLVVNVGGVLVRGIPMPAQTVMFITDTFTLEKQKAKNLFYLTEEQYHQGGYDRKASIFFLEK